MTEVRFILERGFSAWAELLSERELEKNGEAYVEWPNGQKAHVRLLDEGKLWERQRPPITEARAREILGSKRSEDELHNMVREYGVINDTPGNAERLDAAIALLKLG